MGLSGEASTSLTHPSQSLGIPTLQAPPHLDHGNHYAHLGSSREMAQPPPTLPSISSLSSSTATAMPTKRKREDDISSPNKSSNKVIKKAASTPTLNKNFSTNVGVPNANLNDSPTDVDKKRNKLGYHRTSVACGHCRRRKIRCMMPDDNPSGRCSNCIRLKKECNFYPVDQATSKSSRSVSAPKHAQSSSPTPSYYQAAHQPYGNHDPYFHQPHTYPLPSESSFPPYESQAGMHEPSMMPYPPPQTYENSHGWNHPSTYHDLPPVSSGGSESYVSNDGRFYNSPLAISPASQPFTRPASTFNPSSLSQHESVSSRNDITWGGRPNGGPGPLMVNSPGITSSRYSHSPQPAVSADRPDLRRASTIGHPPSLVTGDNSSTPSLNEPTGPLSAPGYPVHSPWGYVSGPPSQEYKTGPPHRDEYAPPSHDNLWYPDPINGYSVSST